VACTEIKHQNTQQRSQNHHQFSALSTYEPEISWALNIGLVQLALLVFFTNTFDVGLLQRRLLPLDVMLAQYTYLVYVRLCPPVTSRGFVKTAKHTFTIMQTTPY